MKKISSILAFLLFVGILNTTTHVTARRARIKRYKVKVSGRKKFWRVQRQRYRVMQNGNWIWKYRLVKTSYYREYEKTFNIRARSVAHARNKAIRRARRLKLIDIQVISVERIN